MTATTGIAVRYSGPLEFLDESARRELVDRAASVDTRVESATREIIAAVRVRGDAALFDLARRFDDADLRGLEVPRTVLEDSLRSLDGRLRTALERSARNIEVVHKAQLPREISVEVEPGVIVARRPDALERIGVYAPGGTAAYASSVLMAAIPARVAGVRDVILCSPPDASGAPSRLVLAAAAIAKVDRVFAVGGAGAIAAMTFGTASVPRVDRIVGPGNAFVAEAKLQLSRKVGIDCPAGPSELLVIADDSCNPRTIALEMLAQAEHDSRASVVAVCVGESVANAIETELAAAIDSQARGHIIREALSARGGILVAADVDDAIQFASEYAAEHLLIAARDAEEVAARVRNSGAIFIGDSSSVAFGDYLTGGNHVLPTNGLGRWYSGLSVLDFIRWTSVQKVSASAAVSLAEDTVPLAMAEGLPAHAATAAQWSGR
jgi:histidinol dehydrogenase